jgi:hypothetical protein
METVQERELLQLQLQGWPSFHAMPASFDAGSGYTYSGSSNSSVGGDGFLLGWEPPFGCFVAADAHLHDLFPLCTYVPILGMLCFSSSATAGHDVIKVINLTFL